MEDADLRAPDSAPEGFDARVIRVAEFNEGILERAWASPLLSPAVELVDILGIQTCSSLMNSAPESLPGCRGRKQGGKY